MGGCQGCVRREEKKTNEMAYARLENKVKQAPALKLPAKEGHMGVGVVDTPRSILREEKKTNEMAYARLENKVKQAPALKLQAKEGHMGAGVVDTPRSMASCSTTDWVEGIPGQKRISFNAAPAEVLHIVPYSEMYLLHPNKFEFDFAGFYITHDESIDANLRSTVCSAKKRR